MPKVYRVEQLGNKKGPYFHPEYLPLNRFATDNHPGPRDDGLFEGILKDFIFACPTFEAVISWFYDELELLKQYDFVINVYDIPDCAIIYGNSGKQLCFHPNHHHSPVETIPC